MAIWPGFFKTLGVRLIAGRDFSEVDDAHHARLAIVSRSFAERLFVNGEAIGKYIRYGFMPDYQNLQIVGIADDAQLFDLRETAPPVIYFSYLQESQPFPEGILYVRAEGNPEALAKTIGREIEALGREYPIRAATLDQMVSRVLVNERVIAVIRQNFIRVENSELNRESSHKGTRSRKLLAKCQILEQEALTRAKEANDGSEGDPEESKHGEDLYRTLLEKTEANIIEVIDSRGGWSFGEAQLP